MSLIARIRWKRVLLAAAAAGGAWAALAPDCSVQESAEVAAQGELLVNRPWLDHIPTSERDMVTHLLFLHKDGQRIGAIGRSSMWRQSAELFEWSPEKEHIKLRFPQDDKSGRVKVEARRCKAPEPFDLCLTLGSGRSATTLYSSADWTLSEPLGALSGVPVDPEAGGEDVSLDLAGMLEQD